jgi:HEAT repeat protein
MESPEIEEIIRDAYDSGVSELVQSALHAMGRSSHPQWLPTVMSDMGHEHPAIRYEAASAAGLLGDETTVPHLIKLIEDDDLEVQLAAVRALGTIGGSLAKRALNQCLKLDDEALEEAAQAALEDLELDDDPLGIRFGL